ncbi:MAG TPA: complex I NDUFA9 subunit family protein [Micropepsaceae bacterium]|nr:complex I NDUFA9 subunit family protein [Micropepsaceae bacterium]
MTAIPSAKLVTVFGGSGFLGRHIIRALARDGWRIRVGVRHPNTAHFLRPMGRVGQIQLVKANLLKRDDVAEMMREADAVINLVGILFQRGSQRFQTIHSDGAEAVARAAADHGIGRVIHFSALGARPGSPSVYARSKAEGEKRVRAVFPGATIMRPSVVFGPEDEFFNRFAALARISPVLPLIGGGHTRFQPVYAGDVAQATLAALGNAGAASQTFELGGPEVMTLKEVMQFVLREIRRRRLLVNVPFGLARFQAAFLGLLPKPPLTPDQVRLLESDNVVTGGAAGLAELGVTPTTVEAIVPAYLWRFRKTGEFETASS